MPNLSKNFLWEGLGEERLDVELVSPFDCRRESFYSSLDIKISIHVFVRYERN